MALGFFFADAILLVLAVFFTAFFALLAPFGFVLPDTPAAVELRPPLPNAFSQPSEYF
ncbi:MAG: hypothetical protein R3E01_23910 [Pirellulaceae bacterium]|nr:hypothetical protein [Planctomycetales bacterium]MCA9265762.1 hypothetical protein [Planctomycetales bacterium]